MLYDKTVSVFIVCRGKTPCWPPEYILILHLIFHSSFPWLWRMFAQGRIIGLVLNTVHIKAIKTTENLHWLLTQCFFFCILIYGWIVLMCFSSVVPWRRGNKLRAVVWCTLLFSCLNILLCVRRFLVLSLVSWFISSYQVTPVRGKRRTTSVLWCK